MAPRLAPVDRFPARTLPAMLVRSAERAGQRPFIHFLDPAAPDQPARVITFGAFAALTAQAVAYLQSAGVGPGDRVLLLAENTPEWQAFSLAAQALRAEPAGLFASLAPGPSQEIALRVAPKVVLVSGPGQWAKLAPAAGALASAGLRAVLAQAPLGAEASAGWPSGVRLTDTAEVLGDGAPTAAPGLLEALAAKVGEEDPFILLFTSGTTGRQKGVRLAQRTIVHAVDCGVAGVKTVETDLGLHLLPFGHVAGHDQFSLALAQGHALAMMSRREDLARALALRPTYLFSVPLIYDRIRTQALDAVSSRPAPVRALLTAALAAGARVRVDGSRRVGDRLLAALADALVGRRVRAALGGRVRGLFSGGAPASVPLFRFFEGLGLPYVELYGMTETAGMVSLNPFDGPRRAGSVGFPSPDHELRVSPEGELQVRGKLCMTGYLDAGDQEGSFTADGYYRTGDLARLEPDGSLTITGRQKHLMVLSTGKKVAPEPIEVAVAAMAPFQGAVLLGEGRPFVSLAVFVLQEELGRLAAHGRDAAEALLPKARAALEAFSEHEKPKKLLVIPGSPQDYPGLLTPTLKLKRDALLALLGPKVAALYA